MPAATIAGNAARLILAVTFDRREPSLDRGTPAKPPTTMIHHVFLVLSISHVEACDYAHHSDVHSFIYTSLLEVPPLTNDGKLEFNSIRIK